ncbi:hypothetical protein [Parashewanella tropica]|uniref:hypothetical protein n=1 Tax=Parashewanella tropica TaxID=2547970 RepID=UPI00105A08EC|nr:hypothetical protein [Parashewanella tropica]
MGGKLTGPASSDTAPTQQASREEELTSTSAAATLNEHKIDEVVGSQVALALKELFNDPDTQTQPKGADELQSSSSFVEHKATGEPKSACDDLGTDDFLKCLDDYRVATYPANSPFSNPLQAFHGGSSLLTDPEEVSRAESVTSPAEEPQSNPVNTGHDTQVTTTTVSIDEPKLKQDAVSQSPLSLDVDVEGVEEDGFEVLDETVFEKLGTAEDFDNTKLGEVFHGQQERNRKRFEDGVAKEEKAERLKMEQKEKARKKEEERVERLKQRELQRAEGERKKETLRKEKEAQERLRQKEALAEKQRQDQLTEARNRKADAKILFGRFGVDTPDDRDNTLYATIARGDKLPYNDLTRARNEALFFMENANPKTKALASWLIREPYCLTDIQGSSESSKPAIDARILQRYLEGRGVTLSDRVNYELLVDFVHSYYVLEIFERNVASTFAAEVMDRVQRGVHLYSDLMH